jgi:aquaporin Z
MLYFGHILIRREYMATKKTATSAKKSPAKKKTSAAAKNTKAKSATKTRVSTTTAGSRSALSASRLKGFSFSRSPLLAASVAEFVGTFLLAAIVLATSGSSVAVLFGLTAIVLMVGAISGAHVNPALTVGAWVTRRVTGARAVSYLVAQVLGALLALVVLNAFVTAAPAPDPQMSLFGQTSAGATEVFKLSDVAKDKEWLFLAAEMLGTAVFALGVASVSREKNRLTAALAIGTSLFVGLTLTGYLTGVLSGAQTGAAVLNPAVATALQGFAATTWQNLWPLSVYAIAPLIGGVLGFALRDLLSEDETKA